MTQQVLASSWFLWIWLTAVAVCMFVLLHDLRRANAQIAGLMKWVWILTVSYSGPLGLAVYYYAGRRQITRDSLWRRAFRSVAHCYSGCGAGEVVGVIVTAGLLSLGTWWVSGVTFALAYVFGYLLTVGPLMQGGVALKTALWDAFYSETASITVMEVTAIATSIWLASGAKIGEPFFWSSLVFSLSVGLLAAYPVNVLLIRLGVKKGMHSPKQAHAH